ncbi:MAG: hypothetical protein ABI036_12960 [Fibrobacteria bacterium]
MLPHSPARRIAIPKALGLFLAALLSQGFYCSEKSDPPTLPFARLVDIHVKMQDPGKSLPGVFLAWDFPADGGATYFEIYQATSKDSLLHAMQSQPATDSFHTVLALPDTTRPFTLYYAVRAVKVEATGQKLASDSLPVDSITIAASLSIQHPVAGTYLVGRTLNMEVLTSSDNGMTVQLTYFENAGARDGNPREGVRAWSLKQDACMPTDKCGVPLFGNTMQRDSLILSEVPAGETIQSLFCVVGTESFQNQTTGLVQSLRCTPFFRIGTE